MPDAPSNAWDSFTKGSRCSADRSCGRWTADAIVSVTGRLYEGLDIDAPRRSQPQRANDIAVAAAPPGAQIRGETTLGILPVEDGYRLAYRMTVLSDWTIRDVYVDAQSGTIVLSINGIHSQAAIGQGNGVFGTLMRKLSTNQTSQPPFRRSTSCAPPKRSRCSFRARRAV